MVFKILMEGFLTKRRYLNKNIILKTYSLKHKIFIYINIILLFETNPNNYHQMFKFRILIYPDFPFCFKILFSF